MSRSSSKKPAPKRPVARQAVTARTAPRIDKAALADAEILERAILLMHEGALEPRRWKEMLGVLGQRLQANSATLILRSPSMSETGLFYVWGGREDVLTQYATRYFALDPFVQLPPNKVITIHDFVPPEQLESSDFFLEHMLPWDSIYHLGVDVRDEGRFYARLRISRPRAAGNYTAEDRAFIERLVPHFDLAIRLHTAFNFALMECAVYADALTQLTLATVILDGAGRIVHTNAMARELLSQNDGLMLEGATLKLTDPAETQRLSNAIERAVHAKRAEVPGIVEVMRVKRPSGRGSLGLVVRPAVGDLINEESAISSAVAVFISTDQETAHAPPVESVRKLFGLTQKEAELALSLADGCNLQEAGVRLGITLNTARAHLRSIFKKTRIDRQAVLVRAILKSVAALG